MTKLTKSEQKALIAEANRLINNLRELLDKIDTDLKKYTG